MPSHKTLVPLQERKSITVSELEYNLSIDDLNFLDKNYKKRVDVSLTPDRLVNLITYQHIGYIILPNHIINITPKVPKISYVNMVRYALGLSINDEKLFNFSDRLDYFDILVDTLFKLLKDLLNEGLNNGYKEHEHNLPILKGKILFKEHLNYNIGRPDKIYCKYSEQTRDILENRIIKYTLFYLSNYPFIGYNINKNILYYYNLFYDISLTPISLEDFKRLEYTPLNERYKDVISLCELFLKDVSLDPEMITGKRITRSFLINMDRLFEKFIANLVKDKMKKIKEITIEEQKTEYIDEHKTIKVQLDILIKYNKKTILILDTKYKQYEKTIVSDHIAQMNLYSDITKVTDCVIICLGDTDTLSNYQHYKKIDLQLYVLCINLSVNSFLEFNKKCDTFISELSRIVFSKVQS